MTKKIIVIGGGPASIEAARTAATAGAAVKIISDAPLGGRAGWHSLLPSKVWLTAADTVGLTNEADLLGLAGSGNEKADPAAILKRIKYVANEWNSQQKARLMALNVDIIDGVGSFEQDGQVIAKNGEDDVVARLQPDATIIAGGSVPFFPPNLRPDGKRILAPRFASHLENLPASIIVIGAGATGSEFVYLFNRLGVSVTWIVDQYGVLPTFARPAGQFLADVFTRRGVNIVSGHTAERIDREEDGLTVVTSDGQAHQAEMAFVAIGRFADLSRLNLEAAGLQVEPGHAPEVDGFCQTEAPGIYVIGDAAGGPMLANRAMAQAWVASRHAVGAKVAPYRAETVIHAIYSEPQVAEVGVVRGNGIERSRISFSEGLKLHLMPEEDGFVELAYNRDGRVTGGLAVGLHAADVLAPVALAVKMKATIADMAALYPAHPTLSELTFTAARAVVRDSA